MFPGFKIVCDLAKNPGTTLCGATNHHGIAAGVGQHPAGFFGRIDIAVGYHGNLHASLDGANRVVFGKPVIKVAARAAVHRKRLDAASLSDACDRQCILVLAVPTRADFQGNRNGNRVNHRFENSRDQQLVFHQRRARVHLANFLGRATHIDVDDMGALVDIMACGFGHHFRRSTGDLYNDRLNFSGMVTATQGLFCRPQATIRRHHLADRHAGTQTFA